MVSISDYKPDFLMNLLESMVLIRRFEEKAAQMYGLRKIGGFCHIYIGQEAICTGTVAALDMKRDYVITAYRDHGHALATGIEPNAVMAELYGKATGCSSGKGGSMHLFDAQRHFMGGHGIVGAHLPLAAGMALKINYMEEDGVVVCFFGDGAIHQGAFHESLNMARIWNLPVIYICENNQYGMGTDFRRVSSIEDLYKMADSYDMPGRQVDGMDVLSVYENLKIAVEQARHEKMPSFLEIRTYRYMGHSMSDPGTYRTREELDEYRKQDPIIILQDKMTEAGLLTEEQYKEIDKNARKLSADSVTFAEQSADPPLSDMYEHVLAD